MLGVLEANIICFRIEWSNELLLSLYLYVCILHTLLIVFYECCVITYYRAHYFLSKIVWFGNFHHKQTRRFDWKYPRAGHYQNHNQQSTFISWFKIGNKFSMQTGIWTNLRKKNTSSGCLFLQTRSWMSFASHRTCIHCTVRLTPNLPYSQVVPLRGPK